tara:strand:- start:19 stop:867 length:849 start_codon:yes stop_codon:yes gene_type:complete
MANSLGKGLEALIKSYNTDETNSDYNILIKNIVPNKNQPRQHFDKDELNELSSSIKKHGIIQPISVRKINDTQFELIAGERRLRASKQAGLKKIPAYIINISSNAEMMEYALIENIQRVDLNPIEEAEGYAILSGKHNYTHSKIAEYVSKSRTEISNKLRLLNLPPIVKEGLKESSIEYGHARALLSLKKSTVMIRIFKKIINEKLNVRQTEILIKSINNKKNKINKKQSNYHKIELELQNYLNTKIEIKSSNKEKGKIIINFSSNEKLNQIINKIKNKFSI